MNINSYDIKVIEALMDKESMCGFSKAKGTTIYTVEELTKLSNSKVRSALKKFKELGWVDDGIKTMNKHCKKHEHLSSNEERKPNVFYKTYYVTKEGLEGIKELKKKSIEDINNV